MTTDYLSSRQRREKPILVNNTITFVRIDFRLLRQAAHVTISPRDKFKDD